MPKAAFIIFALLLAGLAGVSARPAAAFPAAAASAVHMPQPPSTVVQVHSRRYYRSGGRHLYYPYYGSYGRHHRWNGWQGPYSGWRRPYYPCADWSFNCGAYHGYPYYYGDYWWPGFETGIVLSRRPYRSASRHVAWCEGRYRSYNRRNNTWVSYSGKVRQCISPYRR